MTGLERRITGNYLDALNAICKRLGLTDGTALPELPEVILHEIDRHLMPEGMEWPRFETSEPVKLGDSVEDEDGDEAEVAYITFHEDHVELGLFNGAETYPVPIDHGERVKRPAPEVLDADGVEIRVGDTVCGTRDIEPMRVVDTDSHECGFKRIKCEKDGSGFWFYCPDELTHKLPVIAADGKPLREGDVLYSIKTGDSVIVESVDPDNPWFAATSGTLHHCSKFTHRTPVLAADGRPLREEETVWFTPKNLGYPIECRVEKVNGDGSCELIDVVIPTNRPTINPGKLTHERPDSWERLEEDAGKNPFGYCKDVGHRLDTCENSEAYKARDLVRRAKKLAGVE